MSIIVSLIVSYLGGNFIDKISKKRWELILNYEHIERFFNVKYEVLDQTLNLGSKNKFVNFVARLDSNISLKNNTNPCSIARGRSTSPNILLSFNSMAMKVVIVNENKDLILDCEKYIDDELYKFQLFNKEIAKNILKNRSSISDNKSGDVFIEDKQLEEDIKKARLLFKHGMLNFLVTNEEQELDPIKVKNFAQTLMLINLLEKQDQKELLDYDLDSMEMVKKNYRSLTAKEENKLLLNISLFIICQTILVLFLFNNIIFLKRTSFKKKIQYILKK